MRSTVSRRFEFLSVLRRRDYRRYWFGLVASVTSHQALLPAQGWLVYDITGEEVALGFVAAAQAVPAIFFNLVAGALADRMDPRRLIVLGEGTVAIIIAGLATLVLIGEVEVWHVVVSSFLIGISTSLDQPARRVVWPALIERRQFMFATALNQSVWNGTRVFAPMVGTAPIAIAGGITGDFHFGAAVALFLIAAGFAGMAIAIVTIRLPDLPRAAGRTVLHDIADGLRFVAAHRIFLLLLMMSFSIGYFGLSYQWLLPAYAEDVLGLGPEGLGLLHTASGIGGLIGIFLSASFGQQQSKAWMLGGGAGLLGLSVLLFGANGQMQWYWLALAMAASNGGLYAVFQTASNTLLNLLVPTEFRGRVMGLRGVMWSLAPLGALQAGFVAQYTSTPFAIALGGGAVIAVTVLAFVFSAQIRGIHRLVEEANAREGIA
ncbi:MAG: MFS transporter [Chloroflexota bacterium]|nr:MFS transporter [Chloroflexota bacterium]MDE2884947.1 MFS transporter [Chloroflexota bacterium]